MVRVAGLGSPFLLGFDDIERALEKAPKSPSDGYPPYNVEKILRDGSRSERLRLTLAVAGFAREQIEIVEEESQLSIRGRQEEDRSRDYLHRGIAARQFQRNFLLAEGMHVLGADLIDGLLTIEIAKPEPERFAKRIEINARDRKS